jgi:hypothetical protein
MLRVRGRGGPLCCHAAAIGAQGAQADIRRCVATYGPAPLRLQYPASTTAPTYTLALPRSVQRWQRTPQTTRRLMGIAHTACKVLFAHSHRGTGPRSLEQLHRSLPQSPLHHEGVTAATAPSCYSQEPSPQSPGDHPACPQDTRMPLPRPAQRPTNRTRGRHQHTPRASSSHRKQPRPLPPPHPRPHCHPHPHPPISQPSSSSHPRLLYPDPMPVSEGVRPPAGAEWPPTAPLGPPEASEGLPLPPARRSSREALRASAARSCGSARRGGWREEGSGLSPFVPHAHVPLLRASSAVGGGGRHAQLRWPPHAHAAGLARAGGLRALPAPPARRPIRRGCARCPRPAAAGRHMQRQQQHT